MCIGMTECGAPLFCLLANINCVLEIDVIDSELNTQMKSTQKQKTMLRLVVYGEGSDQRGTWATLAEEVDVLTLTVPAFGLGERVVREPHTAHTRVMHSSIPCDFQKRQLRFSLQPPLALCFFSTTTTTASLAARRACSQGCRASCTALACRSGTRFQEHQESRHEAQTMRMIQFRIFLPWAPSSLFLGGVLSTRAHTRATAPPLAREEDGVGPSICAHAVLFYCLIPLCSFYPHTPYHRAAPGGFVSQPGHCCLGT